MEVLQQSVFRRASRRTASSLLFLWPGASSASVVIATEHGAYRLKVGPGEARMYSQEGAYVHIKAGRVVDIDCDDLRIKAKNSAIIEAGQGIVLDTPLTTVTGNMTATRAEKGDSVEMTASVRLQGDITQVGSHTSSGDQIAGGKSQMHHTHPGDSGGTTGEPQ